jgi:hypothetical protein
MAQKVNLLFVSNIEDGVQSAAGSDVICTRRSHTMALTGLFSPKKLINVHGLVRCTDHMSLKPEIFSTPVDKQNSYMAHCI